MAKTEDIDIGVIVGRFQVHQLHTAHLELLEKVKAKHQRVVVLLGVSPVPVTRRNPLDFETRRKTLMEIFPSFTVLPLPDTSDDHVWSLELDSRIREVFPIGTVKLYGGRDSFIQHYTGKFPTEELETTIYVSGSDVRDSIRSDSRSSADFRAGIIYAANNKFPISFNTIDVAILRFRESYEVLVGRKRDEKGYRFIGGFEDVGDPSKEATVRREVREETGIDITDPVYISSRRIDDWRYSRETDKIMTTFFAANYMCGVVQPNDDIHELRWIQAVSEKNPHGMGGVHFQPCHHQLIDDLMKYLTKLSATQREVLREVELSTTNR